MRVEARCSTQGIGHRCQFSGHGIARHDHAKRRKKDQPGCKTPQLQQWMMTAGRSHLTLEANDDNDRLVCLPPLTLDDEDKRPVPHSPQPTVLYLGLTIQHLKNIGKILFWAHMMISMTSQQVRAPYNGDSLSLCLYSGSLLSSPLPLERTFCPILLTSRSSCQWC